MANVNQILREARQQRGISLEEVSQRTFIRLPYLKALEEDTPEGLPDPVYTRGYIRQYAKLLGLDGAALVAQYQGESQHRGGAWPTPVAPQPTAGVRGASPSTRRGEDVNERYRGGNPPIQGGNATNGQVRRQPAAEPPAVGFEPLPGDAIEVQAAKREANQILLAARRGLEEANQILAAARRDAEELRQGAQRYTDEVLAQLEQEVARALSQVRNDRGYLQSRRGPGEEPQPPLA